MSTDNRPIVIVLDYEQIAEYFDASIPKPTGDQIVGLVNVWMQNALFIIEDAPAGEVKLYFSELADRIQENYLEDVDSNCQVYGIDPQGHFDSPLKAITQEPQPIETTGENQFIGSTPINYYNQADEFTQYQTLALCIDEALQYLILGTMVESYYRRQGRPFGGFQCGFVDGMDLMIGYYYG